MYWSIIAYQNKTRPIEWMGKRFVAGGLEKGKFGLPKRLVLIQTIFKEIKEGSDNIFGRGVIGRPKTHDNIGATGVFKSSGQAQYTFPPTELSGAGVACA